MVDKYLLHWRAYQQYKRKIKIADIVANNRFNCTVSSDNIRFTGHLIIINNQTDKRIDILCSTLRHLNIKIPLKDLRGYDRHAETPNIIILTFMEELEQGPILLEFGNSETLEAAFAALHTFLSERVDWVTPPSSASPSSSSGSGSDQDENVNNI